MRGRTFVASLSGAEEVPPADTRARGQAVFRLSRDGSELTYRLIVANIENVVAAHVHLAPAGTNGPVVARLYPVGSPTQTTEGRTQGVLAEGTITAATLQGPLVGAEHAALRVAIEDGDTYVNVHTLHDPGGEVRGQIR